MIDSPEKRELVFVNQDQTRQLKNDVAGSKFLVMVRKDSEDTLSNVSPFLLKKVIDSVSNGEVEACKKLRNGTVLIKTKNKDQTKKLIALNQLTPTISVLVSEHNSLNNIKGVLYSNELREVPELEILDELRNQKVIHVKKIRKKDGSSETGLIILTFASEILPEKITLGYEEVRLRTYIPYPIRCFNCFRFGHPTNCCNSKELCQNCSQFSHINKEKKEACQNEKTCINCRSKTLLDSNHSSLDKTCPIFIKAKAIQSIKSIKKVDTKNAIKIYNETHSQQKDIPNTSRDNIFFFSLDQHSGDAPY